MTNGTNSYAVTHCLGMRGIDMKPAVFNRVAHAAGVLHKAFRASAKEPSKVKSFWRLTEAGHAYAVEVENDRTPEPVVQYLDGRFDDLLAFLQPTIDVMVREGEITPVARDHEKGEAYRRQFQAQQHKQTGEQF